MSTSIRVIHCLDTLLSLILCFSLALVHGFTDIENTTFSRRPLCDVQDRLSSLCMQEVSSNDSIIGCCNRCALIDRCVGASVHKVNKTCYQHRKCDGISGCSQEDNEFVYLEKVYLETCYNGVWQNDTYTCKCDYPWAGQSCQRHMYDCREVKTTHPAYFDTFDHMFNGQPPGFSKPFRMFCRTTPERVCTYLFRNKGYLNFTMNWDDYVKGFTMKNLKLRSSFWMGLETISQFLGPAGKQVELQYRFKIGNEHYTVYHNYSNLVVGDASTNYRLRYSDYSFINDKGVNVTASDCLALSNMTSFSTPDADHDNDTAQNCAMKAAAGWWFSTCNFNCNPLGNFWSGNPASPAGDGSILLPGVDPQIMGYLHSVRMYACDHYY